MAVEKIIRFRDYEPRSRNPDAVHRDPAEPCVIVILPIIRIEQYPPWPHEIQMPADSAP